MEELQRFTPEVRDDSFQRSGDKIAIGNTKSIFSLSRERDTETTGNNAHNGFQIFIIKDNGCLSSS